MTHRTQPSIAVLAIASLALPSLAHAKRIGGGVKPKPKPAAVIPGKAPVAPPAPADKAAKAATPAK